MLTYLKYCFCLESFIIILDYDTILDNDNTILAYLYIVYVCSCVSSVLYFTLGHCMDQCHRSLGSFHLCLFVSPFISAHTFFSKTGTFSSSLTCFSNYLPPTLKNIAIVSTDLWSQITQQHQQHQQH